MEGTISQFGVKGGTVSMTSGAVGDDIAAVTLHADGLTVEATVENDRFVAWWPGAAFDPATMGQPSGEGGAEPFITYDLVLKDGTRIDDAGSWLPESWR